MSEELFFNIPENKSSVIKVLGIGGGGGNAVSNMCNEGIKDVNFVLCNTDSQALKASSVNIQIQLGETLTEGYGAGNDPSVGREAAKESLQQIREVLSDNTKMLFITAGMGGGTGTGGAPIVAELAREMGILVVAIVTFPFKFEGRKRRKQAQQGIEELKNNVDSLIIINNEKIREEYGTLSYTDAFKKADTILTYAAKGIAELITMPGYVNVDLADVISVMKDSGLAVMGTSTAKGENRCMEAARTAINSPLINNNSIKGAKNLLVYVSYGKQEPTIDEMTDMHEYIQSVAGNHADLIPGNGIDNNLDDEIRVMVVATGFGTEDIPELREEKVREFEVVSLDDDVSEPESKPVEPVADENIERVPLDDDDDLDSFEVSRPQTEPVQTEIDFTTVSGTDSLFNQTGSHKKLSNLAELEEIEKQSAFSRLGTKVSNIIRQTKQEAAKLSRISLEDDDNDDDYKTKIKGPNPALHDNVD